MKKIQKAVVVSSIALICAVGLCSPVIIPALVAPESEYADYGTNYDEPQAALQPPQIGQPEVIIYDFYYFVPDESEECLPPSGPAIILYYEIQAPLGDCSPEPEPSESADENRI